MVGKPLPPWACVKSAWWHATQSLGPLGLNLRALPGWMWQPEQAAFWWAPTSGNPTDAWSKLAPWNESTEWQSRQVVGKPPPPWARW